jgi:hypothetical protein
MSEVFSPNLTNRITADRVPRESSAGVVRRVRGSAGAGRRECSQPINTKGRRKNIAAGALTMPAACVTELQRTVTRLFYRKGR